MIISRIQKYRYIIREKEFSYTLSADFEGYEYESKYLTLKDCVLTLKVGYAWDGASRPAINTKNIIIPSAVHDGGYQLLRHGVFKGQEARFKELFDLELQKLCLLYGMWTVRAGWVYVGVAKFGFGACRLNPKIEEYERAEEIPDPCELQIGLTI